MSCVLRRKRRAVQGKVRGFGHDLSGHDGLKLKPRRNSMNHRNASNLQGLWAQPNVCAQRTTNPLRRPSACGLWRGEH
jgi:hypothetical protein